MANETRLGIISALGEASGEGGYATLSFSELQEATGIEDNGHFNYHLKKLVEEFVEDREDGYALTLAGIRAYQAIVAQQQLPSTEVAPFDLHSADECHCGGVIEAWYENGRFHAECNECDESIQYYPVSPRSFDVADPDTLVTAAARRITRDESSMVRGVCPYCTGNVTWSFEMPEGYWAENGMQQEDIVSHVACDDCAWFMYGTIGGKARFNTIISSFLATRGHDPWREPPWGEPFEYTERVLSDDPWRLELTYELEGDELTVTVDGSLNVIDHELTEGAVDRED
ncbi:winged helix-turn-helix domain-containing protein [Halobaculum halobium]|uniref:winged helix-turn-helix domain-containing protein n=2 Tax=Halobaculum halobium TaxID=3032281 RepID=UPI0036F1B513